MTSRWGPFLENALPGTASTESYASLERELAARNVELSEAREQQAATAEVLEVIGASGADAAPVFDKILHSCARHFKTLGSAITVIGADGLLHMAAMHSHAVSFGDEGSSSPEELDAMRERVRSHYPRPVAGTGVEAAVRAGGMLWFPDVLNGPDVPEGLREPVRAMGVNWSQIVAPLMRGDAIVGALSLTRPVGMAFTDRERALLKTFADQAAIAVQNARLFNETREALEHQTATAEVLRVIGGSVADTRPVFDTILQSCARLFNVQASVIMQIGDDGLLHMEALHAHAGDHARQQELEGSLERMRSLYPIPLAGSATAMALDARRVLNFPDVMNGAGVPAALRAPAEAAGLNYSLIMAPLMQGERGIGSIALTRDQLGGFTEKEEALLRSFADQAVIAIQNARLFNETKEALERQTATTEVLQVINASPGELRPVFDAIVERASRLCEADYGGLWLVSGGRARFSTGQSDAPPAFAEYLRSMPDSVGISAFLGRDGAPGGYLHVPDIREIDGYHERQPFVVAMVELGNVRTGLNVPLVDESRAVVGVFTLVRTAVRPFTAAQIALVQSFAAQAQIAMKNARLMRETQESLEQQTASAEVLKVISSSVADAAPVFEKILESCQRLFASNEQGVLLLGENGLIHLGAHHGSARPRLEKLFPVPRETGGEAASGEGSVAHFKDILNDPEVPPRMRAIAEGIGVGTFSQVIAPMLWEGELIGSLYVIRQPPVGFSDKEIGLLRTFADQAVIAIQNSRLFNEIQAKSRELEQANKHKSEFLANMSHELRTPLNAIIGFSEVLSEKMFGEVNDKQLEYLRDIHSSGHHLLSLINDILDLSKIEAGRMELDLASTSLPMLLDNCSTLVRERASRQGLVLALEVEPGVGDWVADVRKLKQVVINLLSNAVKFTPAGGRVTLRARRLERAVEIAVVDTGVGIARDQQALVFEEFRQAGGDYLRKSEGTGLGLSLARRFVELHGGTIRVESEPGQGSTFAFVLPERVLEAI